MNYPDPKDGVFYKATRENGTDFRTGRILYEVGRTAHPEPTSVTPRICRAGYLHASDVPAMTLVGGRWPCRLFEVRGEPLAGFDAVHPHKGGFKALHVEKELPAHWALGPNGLIVSKVIERTRRADALELRKLGAARGAAWGAAWDAAWDAARDAAWDAARGAAWDAARDAAWDAARGAIARDLISDDHYRLLTAAFRAVFGELEEL